MMIKKKKTERGHMETLEKRFLEERKQQTVVEIRLLSFLSPLRLLIILFFLQNMHVYYKTS